MSRNLTIMVLTGLVLWFSGCGSASSRPAETSERSVEGLTGSTTLGEYVGSLPKSEPLPAPTMVGAAVLAADGFSELEGQRVGLIINQASVVGDDHIVDLAFSAGVEIVALFAPEHGVRGAAGAGELVGDEVDETTGLTVFSLYGQTRKPTPEMMEGIDTLVFDLQDVGSRYYTYISTLGLAMQAAAEADTKFVVLDRPNPLGGQRVAGFTASAGSESFISQYPIPSVYGLTSGELASAIIGEKWLGGLENLELTVVELEGWSREQTWLDTQLTWVAPSPGLPTPNSAFAYPATVYFEASTLSYGRGTDEPFQVLGAPWIDADALAQKLNADDLPGVRFEPVTFTPKATSLDPEPRFEGTKIDGVRIVVVNPAELESTELGAYLMVAIQAEARSSGNGSILGNAAWLDLLAGSPKLRLAVENVTVENAQIEFEQVVAEWKTSTDLFVTQRKPYLRY